MCDLKPIGLEEQSQLWVVVAGVEVLEARVTVEAFADEAFGVVGDKDGGDTFGGRGTEGEEGLFAGDDTGGIADQDDGVQLVAVQVALYAIHQPHVGVWVSDEGRVRLVEVAHLDGADVKRLALIGRFRLWN